MAEKLKATDTEGSLAIARAEKDHSQTARAPSDNIAAAISNPGLTPAKILALQRSVGNKAVLQMLATRLPGLHSAPSALPTIQTKLVVGAAGDQYEQEADRVAQQVMSATAPTAQRRGEDDDEEIRTKPVASSISGGLQRQVKDEEEERLGMKPVLSRRPQQGTHEDEEELQTKPLTALSPSMVRRAVGEVDYEMKGPSPLRRAGGDGGFEVNGEIEDRLGAQRGGGTPLVDSTRQFMESRFGADFGTVRVHNDAEADSLNRSLSARAFTVGQDIFFRSSEYNPASREGQELIAHELTHVAQQSGLLQRAPEISATDEAMGAYVVSKMADINKPNTALTGVHYAHNFKHFADLYKANSVTNLKYKEYADKWKDEYWSGYADPAYFKRLGHMDWELLPMTSASEGIKQWLAGGTIAECYTALVAIEIDTLRAAIGDDKFDDLHSDFPHAAPSAGLLRISQNRSVTPIKKVLGQTESAFFAEVFGASFTEGSPGNRPAKKGDWYYFYNHPKYLLKHPGGAFQGENAICVDATANNQLWSGFGVSPETEAKMMDTMASAYNRDRTERDYEVLLETYVSSALAEKKSDNTFASLYQKYKPKIPKEYWVETKEFPIVKITAKDILDASAYTIGNVTRKGGFVVEGGKRLDATQVKALRES